MKLLIAFLAAAALPFACAFPATAQDAAAAPNAADRAFVSQAVAAGYEELVSAQIERHSNDPAVALFAQIVLRDYTAINGQLTALAAALGLGYPAPPPSPPPVGVMTIVPRAYMQQEVLAHQQAIASFKNEAQNGASQQLRTLAAQTLPMLQAHLAMAQEFLSKGTVTPKGR